MRPAGQDLEGLGAVRGPLLAKEQGNGEVKFSPTAGGLACRNPELDDSWLCLWPLLSLSLLNFKMEIVISTAVGLWDCGAVGRQPWVGVFHGSRGTRAGRQGIETLGRYAPLLPSLPGSSDGARGPHEGLLPDRGGGPPLLPLEPWPGAEERQGGQGGGCSYVSLFRAAGTLVNVRR